MRFASTLNRIDKAFEALKSKRLLKALLRYQVLAGAEHRYILSDAISTVVDVGANRGQFALAVRRWAPNARLICLEPLPNAVAVLREILGQDPAVTIFEVALGPESAEAKIHVSARDDSSSLLPITSLQSKIFPGTNEVSTAIVRVEPLSSILKESELTAPAMLKLDVQGFELAALQGAESLLQHFEWVYCECSFVELYAGQELVAGIIEWLASRGFHLTGIHNPSYDEHGKAVQADFLFTRRQ